MAVSVPHPSLGPTRSTGRSARVRPHPATWAALALWWGVALAGGCTVPPDPDPESTSAAVTVQHSALTVDVATREATATLTLRSAGVGEVTLAARGLEALALTAGDATAATENGDLRLGVGSAGDHVVTLEYLIPETARFAGWAGASTYTWPHHCGNLLPCRPHPREGGTFEVRLTGMATGDVAVAPTVDAVAPSYQLAFAYGRYEQRALGVTPDGTRVMAWLDPEDAPAFAPGLDPLPALFAALEAALGRTPFGPEAGPVAVDWGAGARGGMEHHPYWHVARASMADPVVQAHEAAHAWFGGGVRLRCWEDLVLSEGTASWLATYAVREALGEARASEVWDAEAARLAALLAPGGADGVAWPTGCSSEDPVGDGIFGPSVYVKGAFFLRDVASAVGTPLLLASFRTLVERRVGEAAGMQDLIDTVQEETGFDASSLAQGWLRTLGAPAGWDEGLNGQRGAARSAE